MERIPTTIIKAMLPYADNNSAYVLGMLLKTEQLSVNLEQLAAGASELMQTLAGRIEPEYDLKASESTNRPMDVEGMIQAVQAVCGVEERRKLERLLMLLRVRRLTEGSAADRQEAMLALLPPEQKNQLEEMMTLMTLLK